MKKLLLLICTVLLSTVLGVAQAQSYPQFNAKLVLIEKEGAAGATYAVDLDYMGQMMTGLSRHASNYPTQFESEQDKQRAASDAKFLITVMDTLVDRPNPDPQLLYAAARLNAMGHNLDIKGAAEKANTLYVNLLKIDNKNAEVLASYGSFLGSIGQIDQAVLYLNEAVKFGNTSAYQALGSAYLFQGNKEMAIKSLESYLAAYPNDEQAETILDAIKDGRIELKSTPIGSK